VPDGKDMSSFINESSKVLAEIMAATDECNELLRECRGDFAKLEKEDFDEESFLRDPSWEEFKVVQQKWRVFFQTAGSLWAGWSKLKDDIRGAEEDFSKPENKPTASTSLRDTRNPPISTDNSNSHIGRNNSALATSSHPSPPNKAKIPFWRKTLRRIMRCFS
jgi:hypothetical protein